MELEIGTGKGTFLTDHGRQLHRRRYAADRLRRNVCLNARMVRAEAGYFLNEFIPDASLSVLHVYFPDPWPKKRHHKRRLIQPPFLKTVERILVREDGCRS